MADDRADNRSLGLPTELLAQHHRDLLGAESRGRSVSRTLGAAAFFYAAVAVDLRESAILALAGGATLLGLLSYLWVRVHERRRTRLEDLILQELERLHPSAWWKKVFTEWQHEAWKRPVEHTLIRIEPLLWATATIMVLTLRYLRW